MESQRVGHDWLSLPLQMNLKRLTLNTVSHPEMEGIKILGHFWVSWYNWSTNGKMFSSVTQLCAALCNPMDCSTPGFPVYHQLPELAQTHVHRISDAIQPSYHPLSPSPPIFNLSQHQGLLPSRRGKFGPWVGKIPWRREWQNSSILAWEISGTEKPDGLHSMGW